MSDFADEEYRRFLERCHRDLRSTIWALAEKQTSERQPRFLIADGDTDTELGERKETTMSDFAEWRPCQLCGLPVALPKRIHDACLEERYLAAPNEREDEPSPARVLPAIADKALKWPQIEDVLARLNRSTSPYPECWEVGAADVGELLATIFLLVDPELQGIAVSRDYLRTVHALLGFNA